MLSKHASEGYRRITHSVIGKAKTLLLSLVITWSVLCSVSFLTALFSRFVEPPEDLPVPWSGFDDFVEGVNGIVYVHIANYARVFCYNRAGHFIASYPSSGSGIRLAAGTNGLIYARAQNSVSAYDVSWKKLSYLTEVDCASRTWRQGRAQPSCVPDSKLEVSVPDRAILPGELLYAADDSQPRTHFASVDGTVLERRGNALVRLSTGGDILVRYDTLWYLSWSTLPWPFLLGCVAYFFLLLALVNSAQNRAQNSAPEIRI